MTLPMRIQLRRGKDGPSTLTCVRADGSRTWSKVHPFFPVHDLTHCAVESVLGFREAFFGLVASGWALETFGPRVPLPLEARWAECIVGLLDLERAQPRSFPASQFNEMLAASLHGQGLESFRPVTDEQLDRVSEVREQLAGAWRALPMGGTLEVSFPATGGAGSGDRLRLA